MTILLAILFFCILAIAQLITQTTFDATSYQPAYQLQYLFQGDSFLNDSWKWEDFDDPTHGRVNYLDRLTAQRKGLAYVDEHKNTFFMRSDSSNIVSPASRGRDSVRISSTFTIDEGLVIIDLLHMPEGCATWPAFWTLSEAGPWPSGGEIDIIEGVNLNTNNLASLHTTPNCSVDSQRDQTGQTISTNCDTAVNFNQGCGTSFTKPNSYGTPFNSQGGGWYAMQKSARSGISVWFWSRHDTSVPDTVRYTDGCNITTNSWGTPDATFPMTHCDYDSHFDPHSLVFDLTFCGDWAGNVFQDCSTIHNSTCDDFVNNNPSQFVNAYWEITTLRTYTLLG